ncbi:N-6 DNA methylase [Halobacterium sp. CBA1126]|uniref:N-6 DNA methylase n=1 Tax=Halobacterium sp. CBA1126 TaxID=2668074 RepID=UPI0012FACB1E|nr:N-6 DNA methylase [Halobacterium sp. CBA1126]MUV60606.1 N-6 DNA methylase [Halobacterium sp. CBA1126]
MADLSDFIEDGDTESGSQDMIEDYLTGREIEETEENKLRNRYIRYLIEERGFDEKTLKTVPEWRVPPRPSASRTSNEAKRPDFVYFDGPDHNESEDRIHTVGETKTRHTEGDSAHEEAESQVKWYLTNESQAEYGVAVSDLEDPFKVTVFADTKDQAGRKNVTKVNFDPPLPGEELDVDASTRIRDLEPFDENPKQLTSEIRDYVHAHDESATDDLTMAKQWAYMILTKLKDEEKPLGERPALHIREGDDANAVANRVDRVFKRQVLDSHPAVFGTAPDKDEWEIQFDDETKRFIVSKLQEYSLQKTDALFMREAFEVFITDAVKGDEGQFYTRRNLCEGMARVASPNPGDNIGDLAAGTGGLLGAGIEEVSKKLRKQLIEQGQEDRHALEVRQFIESHVFGVDKAHFAVDLMEAELEAMAGTAPNVFRKNSIKHHRWDDDPLPSGRFDVLFANFPYGSGLKETDQTDLQEYELGYQWESTDGDDGPRELTDVSGIGPSTAEDLQEAEYEDIGDVYEAEADELADIPGIGGKTAEKILDDISKEDVEELRGEGEEEEQEPFVQTDQVRDEQEISILFLELYHEMLSEGGRAAIVFPETHLVTDDYVAYWLRRKFRVHAVWDLPDQMFQPHTHAKMVVLFLEKPPADVNPREEDYPIFMGTIEQVGHNQRGNPLYKRDDDGDIVRDEEGRKVRKDHIPDMAEVTLDWFIKTKDFIRNAEPDGSYFEDGNETPDLEGTDLEDDQVTVSYNGEIEDDTLVPRAYQRQPIERARQWAEEHDCELVQLSELMEEGVVEAFRGHGGVKKEWYSPDNEIPYINTSRVSKFEVSTVGNHVKRVPKEVYESSKEKLEIQPGDIFIVKRGENYIGNVGIVHPAHIPLLSAAENDILRVDEDNDYNLTPAVLLYLLSQDIVTDQLQAKHEYETIIWNVSDRYQEVYLPIPQDEEFRKELDEAVQKRAEGFGTLVESIDSKMDRVQQREDDEKQEMKPEN